MRRTNHWGTSISCLTNPARTRRGLTARLAARSARGAVALVLCGLLAAQEVTLLDLTRPVDYPPSNLGLPGKSGGGVSHKKSMPYDYRIPLEVTIVKVEPREVVPGSRDKVLFEIEYTNKGPDIFFFPVSRDHGNVLRNENKGRRSVYLFIEFDNPDPVGLSTDGIGSLAGSPSIPESLKRLEPGDSVLVRALVALWQIKKLLSDTRPQVAFRAGYSEDTLEDGRFFVEKDSEQVLSHHTFTLRLRQDQRD